MRGWQTIDDALIMILLFSGQSSCNCQDTVGHVSPHSDISTPLCIAMVVSTIERMFLIISSQSIESLSKSVR